MKRSRPSPFFRRLRELEVIYESLGRVGSYAGLLYAADTAKPEYQDLTQRVEQRSTEVRNLLLFFELEWLKFDDTIASRLIADPTLEAYRHYLISLRRYRPHTLSELEEKVINDRDNTGRNAFGRLFSEITSSLTFAFEKQGEKADLNLSQILSLLHEPDRALRQSAMETLYQGLSQHGQVLTFIYDTLIQDQLTMDRLRSYPDPMAQRHLFNEIDGAAVKTMMAVVEENYGLAHDYFRLKAKLLKLPRLALYDQYAPVGKEVRPFPYHQARQVILAAFDAFDPKFRQIAAEFFDKNWIDAEIRKGKRGGAFCASPSPQLHPYILCNYDDNLRDVMTVAHELGHGLHGCLSRKQKLFQLRHAAHHRRDRFGVRRNARLRLLARAANRSAKCKSRCSPARSKTSSPPSSVKTCSRASRSWRLPREKKNALHRTRSANSGSKPTANTTATPSTCRTVTAGAGRTSRTSSIHAFTATATSSASSWSSRFIECTKTKAKASCRNISRCSKPAVRIHPKHCSSHSGVNIQQPQNFGRKGLKRSAH